MWEIGFVLLRTATTQQTLEYSATTRCRSIDVLVMLWHSDLVFISPEISKESRIDCSILEEQISPGILLFRVDLHIDVSQL